MFKNNHAKLNLIPLGGIGEIGKNMLAVEYESQIIVIDAGVAFPEEEMLGVDLVIPDIAYLLENRDRVRAIILTHGHEDHIGALPYVLRNLDVPYYGTRLTLGLVEGKLAEHGTRPSAGAVLVKPSDTVQIGPFAVEFLRVSHSIPDVVALAIHTPLGCVFHSSDFKLDQTPVDRQVTDFHRIAELGEKGVLVLLSDSTNAERPGYTRSEREVGYALEETFRAAPKRIIVATFASNIHRLQQIIDAARRSARRVCVVGRSMVNVVRIASDLGYLDLPEDMVVDVDRVDTIPPSELVIITTGSQGEPMSALTRIANSDHRKIQVIPGDTVIISASWIPGNERLIGRVINQLFKQGAEVTYAPFSDVHASGHGAQEEMKLMINLTRPNYFIPIHGEYRHLIKHARIAEELGLPKDHIFIPELGDVIQVGPSGAAIVGRVPAGRVLVDGLGVGDVGSVVLRDRKQLAEDGIVIVVLGVDRSTGELVAGPEVVSRGFVYVKESEELLEDTRQKVEEIVRNCQAEGLLDWGSVKGSIRDSLGSYFYEKMKRRPMIMTIVLEL